jgi:hypothetical protein
VKKLFIGSVFSFFLVSLCLGSFAEAGCCASFFRRAGVNKRDVPKTYEVPNALVESVDPLGDSVHELIEKLYAGETWVSSMAPYRTAEVRDLQWFWSGEVDPSFILYRKLISLRQKIREGWQDYWRNQKIAPSENDPLIVMDEVIRKFYQRVDELEWNDQSWLKLLSGDIEQKVPWAAGLSEEQREFVLSVLSESDSGTPVIFLDEDRKEIPPLKLPRSAMQQEVLDACVRALEEAVFKKEYLGNGDRALGVLRAAVGDPDLF